MTEFILKKTSILSRDDLYKISTDVSNFYNVFPKYFKSIQILDKNLVEAENQYQIAVRNHLIQIENLVSVQDARVRGLQE